MLSMQSIRPRLDNLGTFFLGSGEVFPSIGFHGFGGFAGSSQDDHEKDHKQPG